MEGLRGIPVQKYLQRLETTHGDVEFFQQYNIKSYFAKQFRTHIRQGLKLQQVEQNRKLYGSNHLPHKKLKTFFELFMGALCQDMLIILMFAAVISIILQGIYSQQRNIFWVQGASILLAVAVCSIVAAVNDYQKQKQFEELNVINQRSNHYDVLRNGQRTSVMIQQIVAGDLLLIAAGIQIPADGYIIQAINIIVDQGRITGQSHQVYKDIHQKCIQQINSHPCPSSILLGGSKIISGQGKMLVAIVGQNSQLGKLNKLINSKIDDDQDQNDAKTPLQAKLDQLAAKISYFGLYSGILIFVILIIRLILGDVIPQGWNTSKNLAQILKYLIISVSIIVVAVPQGLPLAVTLSLAFSVKKMLDQNNLVRKLASCQTMGGANIICTDKTGTLTTNKMTVVQILTDKKYQFVDNNFQIFQSNKQYLRLLLNCIFHNSSSFLRPFQKGSQTQISLLKFAQSLKKGQTYQIYRQRYSQNGYFIRIPFSSDRKRMTTGVQQDGKYFVFMTGAAQNILPSCTQHLYPDYSLRDLDRRKISQSINDMANRGLRVIALSYKQVSSDANVSTGIKVPNSIGIEPIQKMGFNLLMIIGIRDLPRPQSKSAIEQCRKAGINIIMITGDNMLTAKNIALDVGIVTQSQLNNQGVCLLGHQFQKKIDFTNNDMSPDIHPRDPKDHFVQTVANLKILARSRPQHKYMLVQGLKKLDNVVAVTGDGTNDVPALLKADVGFAMGQTGTQIAKNAADIIILDDNFKSIVRAVVWGRNVYDSIRKFLQFQLTANLVAVGLSFVSSALVRQPILNAVQMLWVNLIMDSLASLALSTQPPNSQTLLNRKPHSRRQSLLSSRMIKHILGQSIFQFGIIIYLLFYGQLLIPEYVDGFDKILGTDLKAKYHNGQIGGTVANGCFYQLDGSDAYYLVFEKYHVYSRHFTFLFNTFVFMQIFNFFNCRRVHDQKNLFSDLFNNWIFIAIFLGTAIGQVLIVQFLYVPFKLYSYGGLTIQQWLLSIAVASVVVPFSIFLRFLPFGKQATQQIQPEQYEKQQENKKDKMHQGYQSVEIRL